ncbi:uncharacterized protein B0H18DRAFT_97070 [Fomitopsis serialis]|uniref:uncharacterized protein n=1 Tax=Fomitopsis serialis TaxID=139415 RepID=UPI0020077BF8|nr:uncharacterized protein B0H18DRAFT_97070 [Neoantrodia serialis]KAH9915401.1 hypothetical protein B0H18DRAFT_97070 [Neoantrodia serialis]
MQRRREDTELPTIPLELHDNVINYLWDDLSALGVCSLVSHTWLVTARSHKFRTVSLQSCYKRTGFEELLDSPLLNSCSLARYVHELHIGVDPQDNAVCEPKLQRALWHDLGLIRLLRELTELEVLRLENLWWDPSLLSQEMADYLLAYTRKVKHLHICSVAFLHMGDMLRVLLSAPDSERASLVLSWCSADSHSIPAASLAEFSGRDIRLGR